MSTYIGFFLDDESQGRLLKAVPPRFIKRCVHEPRDLDLCGAVVVCSTKRNIDSAAEYLRERKKRTRAMAKVQMFGG